MGVYILLLTWIGFILSLTLYLHLVGLSIIGAAQWSSFIFKFNTNNECKFCNQPHWSIIAVLIYLKLMIDYSTTPTENSKFIHNSLFDLIWNSLIFFFFNFTSEWSNNLKGAKTNKLQIKVILVITILSLMIWEEVKLHIK